MALCTGPLGRRFDPVNTGVRALVYSLAVLTFWVFPHAPADKPQTVPRAMNDNSTTRLTEAARHLIRASRWETGPQLAKAQGLTQGACEIAAFDDYLTARRRSLRNGLMLYYRPDPGAPPHHLCDVLARVHDQLEVTEASLSLETEELATLYLASVGDLFERHPHRGQIMPALAGRGFGPSVRIALFADSMALCAGLKAAVWHVLTHPGDRADCIEWIDAALALGDAEVRRRIRRVNGVEVEGDRAKARRFAPGGVVRGVFPRKPHTIH